MIGMKVTKLFFDTKAITNSVAKATQRNLSKFGAFVRTRSRSSIRRRKKSSAPGKPPSNRTGLLKRFIFFNYDPQAETVIIGPGKTNQIFFNKDGQPVTGTVPEVLEYGGEIGIFEVFKFGRWQRADLRSRRRIQGRKQRLRRVKIKARPFMVPAFEKEKSKLPALWAGSVKP